MPCEAILNTYYNIGGFNNPSRIGFMMKLIRTLRPLTLSEWKLWYLSNVHDDFYISKLAVEMCNIIPAQYNITILDCKNYIYDVMFRRTFNGFNKEKEALDLLKSLLSPNIQEAPENWDTIYFIDFYLQNRNQDIIGIQLKPVSFYLGHYNKIIDINGKLNKFRSDMRASAFILIYEINDTDNSIIIKNPEVINEIKDLL